MKPLILIAFLLLASVVTTMGGGMMKTWDDIKMEIESVPNGGQYKLPVGVYQATKTIAIRGDHKTITGNVVWDDGHGVPKWATPKRYTIIVLVKNKPAFELMPHTSNLIINLQVDQELYRDYRWPDQHFEFEAPIREKK